MRSILSLNVYINGYKQHDIYSYMQPQVNNMDNKSRPVFLETRLHPMHANASDIFYSFYLRFTLPILLGTKPPAVPQASRAGRNSSSPRSTHGLETPKAMQSQHTYKPV